MDLIGIAVFNPRALTPNKIRAWLTSGLLTIWRKDGIKIFEGPLYRLPSATSGAMRKLRIPVPAQELGKWKAPRRTWLVLTFDNGTQWISPRARGVFAYVREFGQCPYVDSCQISIK